MSLVSTLLTRPGCPLCGEPGRACGSHTTTPGINPLHPEELLMPGEPVHEYDVVHNGYDTVMNLTEKQAARDYPDAKRRSGPVAPDHPDNENTSASSGRAKARTSPNK